MKGKHNMIRRKKGTEGLTLIELIVVMCILAVMVLISIPNIGRWLPRYRLRGAVRDVASAMQLARLGAIKDNNEWAIQYDANAQTYTVLSDDGADGAWGTLDDVGYKGDVSPWTLSTRRLADYRNVNFGDNGYGSWLGGPLTGDLSDGITFGNNCVEFRPDGTAGPDLFNGIVGSVYLQNNRGDAACARVRFAATGAIEVVHWNGVSWEP
jgi:type II secretory pathway pseudopilin PulG